MSAARGCPFHADAGGDSLRGAVRTMLRDFARGDEAQRRQLRLALQKLEASDDQDAALHFLIGAASFQLEEYERACEHLAAACESASAQPSWHALRERAEHNRVNEVQRRRAPLEPFRAETLRSPAVLALREPEGVRLPAPAGPRERAVDGFRTATGAVLGPVVRALTSLVGKLGAERSWRTKEKLSTELMGEEGESPVDFVRVVFADLLLSSLRTRMNAETLQDPYPGDLAAQAPVGQRRPEWTKFFPTADGSWRTDDPNMGRAGTRFPRQGRSEAGEVVRNRALDSSLPSPRRVSRELLQPRGERSEAPFLNLLAVAWIQFQVHGWFEHRQLPPQDGMLRIPLEEDDPIRLSTGQTHLEFRKTQPDVLQDRGPEYFQNEVTHWWDASQLYGSDQATEDRVRTGPDGALLPGGKLYMTPEGRLPIDAALGVEDTGFNRNWWVGLSFFHELFAREHNWICDALRAEHPDYSSDHLFKLARLEVAAKMARIHTVEWTPAVLPNRVLSAGLHANWSGFLSAKLQPVEKRRPARWWAPKDSSLGGLIGGYTNTYGKPRMFSENFSEVYRLHAAVPDTLRVRSPAGETGEQVPLERTREAAAPRLLGKLGLESLGLTLGHQHMPALVGNNYPRFMASTSTDELAQTDLGAADILRARERGVPSYNQFRAQLGRPRCRDYHDITEDPEKAARLEAVYGKDGIERVDLQVGMLFEDGRQRPFQGFDNTRFAVFLQEASRRLEADPFFTEKWNDPRVYTPSMRERIGDTTLKDLLLRHVPALATSGLMGVDNAFEPWGTTVETHPEEHPLSATEEWYASRSAR
ncbi:MAG: peroxidase family protein [Polyangiales bacterium]